MANAASNASWATFPTSRSDLINLESAADYEFSHNLEDEAWSTNTNSNKAPETNRTIPNQVCCCMVANRHMNEMRGSMEAVSREMRCLRGDVSKTLASGKAVEEWLSQLFHYQAELRETLKRVIEYGYPEVGLIIPDGSVLPASSNRAATPSKLRNQPPHPEMHVRGPNYWDQPGDGRK